jgi:hypothetical protein
MSKLMPANNRAATPTTIPTIAPVERCDGVFPWLAVAVVKLVILTDASLKRLPLSPSNTPGTGCCSHPASKATRTGMEVSKTAWPRVKVGGKVCLTVGEVSAVGTGLQTSYTSCPALTSKGGVVCCAIPILGAIDGSQPIRLESRLERVTDIINGTCRYLLVVCFWETEQTNIGGIAKVIFGVPLDPNQNTGYDE